MLYSLRVLTVLFAAAALLPGTLWADPFSGKRGCFLLYDLTAGKMVSEIGGAVCKERFSPCSTFKVPLAVMAFDSGVLKDENEVLKWDGKVDPRPAVNQDHNAKTWMRDSVVWFSQRLTPKMGEKKLQTYLKSFRYGNEDLSAGLTEAWIVPPDQSPALMISAYEQLEFMKALWTDKLPASKRSLQLTREITFLETSPGGFRLSGKTGSHYYHGDPRQRLGWFIAHLQKGKQAYLTVLQFSDRKAAPENTGYGGMAAKELTKAQLREAGIW